MGNLKIEELEDLTLFKKWFRKIEEGAKREASKGKNIRKWANTEIKKKFRDELKDLDYNPEYEPRQKYEIRPNKENKTYHKGGWLYDFCLRELEILDDKTQKSKKIKKPKIIINLKKMILAMEVEMTQNDGSIRNDFHKLLQSDAQYKIMIFQRMKKDKGVNKGDVNDTFDMLEKTVEDYKPKFNSKYLIFGWCILSKEFMYSQFEVKEGRIYKNIIKRGKLPPKDK